MYSFRNLLISQRSQLVGWVLSKNQCSTTALIPMAEQIEKRNYLFSQEQKRQLEEIGRIEKIAIEVTGPPEDIVLMMNQDISTPYDCCKHISTPLSQQTPLALVNDKILWDMHRPLPGNCGLRFLSFKDKDPFSLNEVFWRTGSFILGAVILRAFKEDVAITLHSFPPPVVKSGSFVYDVVMDLDFWEPTEEELKVLSAEFLSFVQQNHKIERLSVKKSLAIEIFEGNRLKQKQIPNIAEKAPDHLVTLYRVADHIDISCGPMVGNTSFFGRSAVTAVHPIETDFKFYRFQGVALPKGIMLNPFGFGIIEQRGASLNEADLPCINGRTRNKHIVTPNTAVDCPSEPLHSPI